MLFNGYLTVVVWKKEVYGFGLELYGKDFRSPSKLLSDILAFKDRFFQDIDVEKRPFKRRL